jgi:hypothetical protein
MAWEHIEQDLKNALTVKISLTAGTIFLPETHLTIDDWLTGLAQTDEELRELNIPRIRFLQNRWQMGPLVEFAWNDEFSSRRVVLEMEVGRRAYILFSDWKEYQVIAALEPKDSPSLYRAVIGKILETPEFIPAGRVRIFNRRPDLIPELPEVLTIRDSQIRRVAGEHVAEFGGPLDWMHPESQSARRWDGFLSEIFVGWIGKWLNSPEGAYWREELPESISRAEEGQFFMKYEPTYGDKQRDAQKRQQAEHNRDEARTAEVPAPAVEQAKSQKATPGGDQHNSHGRGAA